MLVHVLCLLLLGAGVLSGWFIFLKNQYVSEPLKCENTIPGDHRVYRGQLGEAFDVRTMLPGVYEVRDIF